MNKDNIYKYFNDIETDFSEYEEETLTPEEVSQIKSRVYKKMNLSKKTNNKTLTWIGRAAIISICCLAIGGGVYAATTLRKNNAYNLRIKSTQSEIVSTEDNKVTKKIHDEETGGELTYDVYASATDADSAEGASLVRISKKDELIYMNVDIKLDDISKVESFRESLDYLVNEGHASIATPETFDDFTVSAKLEDTEMFSYLNNYSVSGNTLSLEVVMDTLMTAHFGEDTDVFDVEYDPKTGPASLSQEDYEKQAEYMDNYYASLPDPLNSSISLDIFLGGDLGENYSFVTSLEGNYESGENETHEFNGGSATIEWYGQKESVTINSYSIEANGLQVYGDYFKELDQAAYDTELANQGLFAYDEELRIRAWDDLGNTYLLKIEPGNYMSVDPVTGYETYDTSTFVASICDDGYELGWYKEVTGIEYSSQWADGISQITIAIERFTRSEDGTTREVTATCELVSDPVTIDLQ